MCLFPLGAVQSNPTIPPPNEKCEKYVEKMKVIFYMLLILGFVNLFLGFQIQQFLNSSIFCFIMSYVIYQAYDQISYCNCIIYIFFAIYQSINNFVFFGTQVQNHIPLYSSTNNVYNIAIFVLFFSLFFFVVSGTIVFYIYREFKAVNIGALLQNQFSNQDFENQNNYRNDIIRQQQNQQSQQQSSQSTQQGSGFRPFQGRGVALGGI